MTTTEAAEPFSMRFPIHLRERIRQRAITNRRSLNAEMLVLMETALRILEAKDDASEAA